MESASQQGLIETALEKSFNAGFEAAILGLEKTLARRLHADYTMDRVIRSTITAAVEGMWEALKETKCQASPSTKVTTSPNF